MPPRHLNTEPQNWRQAPTFLPLAEGLLVVTGEQEPPWCHQMSAAVARGCNLPLVTRGFSNRISRKILTSNYHLELRDWSVTYGRNFVPLQATIHGELGCNDTFTTSEKRGMWVYAWQASTQPAVGWRQWWLGRVHEVILAELLMLQPTG